MITTRHEAGATHMADGYARASGKPGVALVVPGAGLYNAASGIATAYARSSPVLVIVGQISRGLIGKNLGIYHEISDQPSVVRPVTKWQRQALRPREIPDAVCEAFRQMRTGRLVRSSLRSHQRPGWSERKSHCEVRQGFREMCRARKTFERPPTSSSNLVCP